MQPLSGQAVTISTDIEVRNDRLVDIVGYMNDNILIFRHQQSSYLVQAYDKNLNFSWEKDVSFEEKNIDVKLVINRKSDFCVVYGYKKKGIYYMKAKKFDSAAEVIDSALIFSMDKPLFIPRFQMLTSENEGALLIYNFHQSDFLEFHSFDLDEMKLVRNEKGIIKRSNINRNFYSCLISDDGDVAMILNLNNNKQNAKTHQFKLYTLGPNIGSQEIEIPLNGKLTYDATFVFDALNESITGGGLYSEKSLAKASGYFYLSIPYLFPKNFKLEYNQFEKALVENFGKRKRRRKKKGNISEARVRDIVLRRDGGILLIAEYVKDLRKTLPRRICDRKREYPFLS